MCRLLYHIFLSSFLFFFVTFPRLAFFYFKGAAWLWTAEGESVTSVMLWGGIVICKDTFSCQAFCIFKLKSSSRCFFLLPRMWRVQHVCPQAVRPFHAVYCIHTHTRLERWRKEIHYLHFHGACLEVERKFFVVLFWMCEGKSVIMSEERG
jgi:hypothetical protein